MCLFCTPFFSVAQNQVEVEIDEPNRVIFISSDKAGNEVIRILDKTKSPKFNEHNTPRFLLTSKNDNFALGIGGYVRALASYDFGGIADGLSFNTSKFPAPGTTGVRNQYQMDISHSTLFVKLVGKTEKLGDIVAYINGNFTGDNYGFKLHNAYVQFLGFLVGYNFGQFMDQPAVAPTIDYLGPSGMVNYRVIQLSYTYDKLKNWSFAGAIEMPKVGETLTGSSNGYSTESASQRMPNITANAQYSWGLASQVRAAAVVRSMTYNSVHNDVMKAKSDFGWGLQLSSIFDAWQGLKLFGQVTYGKGIGSYINDLDALKVDLTPNPDKPGTLQATPTLGWYAGLRYNFIPSLFVSTTYSQSRIYAENGWPSDNSDFYKKGRYFVANVFWNITTNMQTGLEYLRGWRSGFADNSTRHANRFNLMLQYSF